MTLRELGYSIQDAFANVGEWFQEMLWIAFNGSWFDLTIGQFIVFVVIVVAVLYVLAVIAYDITKGTSNLLASEEGRKKGTKILVGFIIAVPILILLMISSFHSN